MAYTIKNPEYRGIKCMSMNRDTGESHIAIRKFYFVSTANGIRTFHEENNHITEIHQVSTQSLWRDPKTKIDDFTLYDLSIVEIPEKSRRLLEEAGLNKLLK